MLFLFLRTLCAVLFSIVFFVGCGKEAMTSFNGNHGALDGQAAGECKIDSDCNGSNLVCDATPKGGVCRSRDCRQDGCLASQVCNEYTGVCEKPTACVPDCTGRECGSDGCGGQCGTCGANQVCTALTGECDAVSGSDCRQDGCSAGKVCNASNGKCEATGGIGECELRSLSGVEFTLYGSGVQSVASAEAGWSNPITSVNGKAKFSLGGMPIASFNMKRADGLWGFGWDGIDPSYTTKVVGDWELRCGSDVFLWYNGLQQGNCGSTLPAGTKCLKTIALGKYRFLAAPSLH